MSNIFTLRTTCKMHVASLHLTSPACCALPVASASLTQDTRWFQKLQMMEQLNHMRIPTVS